MMRRILAVSIAAFFLASCGNAAAPSSAGPSGPQSVPAASSAAPVDAAAGSSLKDASDRYLAYVTAWNAKWDAVNASFDAAGSDQTKLGQAWADSAALQEEFITGLRSISWPAEVQPLVDQFITDTRQLATASRALAGDPQDAALGAQYDMAQALTQADAVKLRQVLGLPPLVAAATPEPTAAVDEPTRYKVGERITITENGTEVGAITVDEVREDTYFKGDYSTDAPDAGNVFLSAHLTYQALANGFNYNPYDWQVFADGMAVDGTTFTLHGPEPDLGSGSLPKGRKAAGWLVYEVPKNGEVLLSYGSTFNWTNAPPPFEVLLRKS